MWWREVQCIGERLAANDSSSNAGISPDAIIEEGVLIDESSGPVIVGRETRICTGAILKGPIEIGAHCLIGNNAMLRGPLLIKDEVRVGYASEIKQALIARGVTIGPLCFIADSQVEEAAYLGAMVRTSNHRLDGQPVSVLEGDQAIQTGCEKLGCRIGARAALGIQVIVLPGRVIAPDTVFEPRFTVAKNYPQGHYRNRQEVECVVHELLHT